MMNETSTKGLRAFHGDPAIKAKYVARVQAHREADEIIKGRYWERGKGCAVGCTIHGSDHCHYETELGISATIARLEDVIFEGLPAATARDFPLRFLDAIPVGADLAMVVPRFLVWLLTSDEIGLSRIVNDDGRASLARVADLWQRRISGDDPTPDEWRSAANIADAAAYAVADAVAYAVAYAVADAVDAAYAVAQAAYAVAQAVADAALAARATALAALAACAADAADADIVTWSLIAEKLLSLLAETR